MRPLLVMAASLVISTMSVGLANADAMGVSDFGQLKINQTA